MKNIIFVLLVLFFLISSAGAEELYTWTDKNGVENITTTPPPEKAKVKHQTKYKRPSAQESEAFQRKASAAVNKSYRGWQNSQRRSDPPSQSMQAATESAKKRKEKMENTDRLSKEFWDAVELQRTKGKKVDKNLSEQYHDAVEDDPRTIKTTTITTRSR